MKGYLKLADGTELKVGETRTTIKCFRCGICCINYRPKVAPEEIRRIAGQLGLPVQEFRSRYGRTSLAMGATILKNEQDTCPFLLWDEESHKATCTIHPFRPQACRNWVASLSCPECREGLRRMRAVGRFLVPDELYASCDDIKQLCSAVINDECGGTQKATPAESSDR